MKYISNFGRRWMNPDYRFAHRNELPTKKDWFIVALICLTVSFAGWTWDKSDEIQQTEIANETTNRVLRCLEGTMTLGSYQDDQGNTWEIRCSTIERKVRT